MNLKVIDKNEYLIYLNNQKLFLADNEENIKDNIKKIIITLMKVYKINIYGFYKVNIFNNNKIGNFIELKKIDSFDIDKIDLKIILFFNSKFLLETNNYEIIKDYKIVYYYNNNFYIDIDEIGENDLLLIIEHGKIIYGHELEGLLKKTYKIII